MESSANLGLPTNILKRTGLASLFTAYTRLFEGALLQALGGDHTMTMSTLTVHAVGDIAICLGVGTAKDRVIGAMAGSTSSVKPIVYVFMGGVTLNYVLHLGIEPLYHMLSDGIGLDGLYHHDMHVCEHEHQSNHDGSFLTDTRFALVVAGKVFAEELSKLFIFKK
ncbi:MAG: hypothetical protein WC004_04885 [Candidatus Absconditabacterales bacterium]